MKTKIILALLLIGSLFLFVNCSADDFTASTWTFVNESGLVVEVTPKGNSLPSYSFTLSSYLGSRDVTWYGSGSTYYYYEYSPSVYVKAEYDYIRRRITFRLR